MADEVLPGHGLRDRLPAAQVESRQGGWGQMLEHLARLLVAETARGG